MRKENGRQLQGDGGRGKARGREMENGKSKISGNIRSGTDGGRKLKTEKLSGRGWGTRRGKGRGTKKGKARKKMKDRGKEKKT